MILVHQQDSLCCHDTKTKQHETCLKKMQLLEYCSHEEFTLCETVFGWVLGIKDHLQVYSSVLEHCSAAMINVIIFICLWLIGLGWIQECD